MQTSKDQHVRFWGELAQELEAGQTLVSALDRAGPAFAGDDSRTVAEIVRSLRGGTVLSEAMCRHPALFPSAVCAMVRAGEAGGVLGVIARRTAEAIAADVLPLPGAQIDPESDALRFWRLLAVLLPSGVPILQALELARDVLAGERFREAVDRLRRGILDGKDVVAAMAETPDVFPPEVCRALEHGERTGDLTGGAIAHVADAVEAGNLNMLATGDGVGPSLEGQAAPGALSDLYAELKERGDWGERGEEVGEGADRFVTRFVNAVLLQAVRDKASDVHLEPFEDRFTVRLRIDGVLYEWAPLPTDLGRRMVNRLKLMGCMDLTERRLPQDARIRIKMRQGDYDIRVSTLPVRFGERMVLRLLARKVAALDLAALGFVDDDLAAVRRLCHLPSGMVVATGPAGCGKTTLLYAMLTELNEPSRGIITVEDPVECDLPAIGQVQINPGIGLTYPRALRSVLRQAPNIVMVGELRDLETASLAAQTGMTGHLLLSTMHTNSTVDVLIRLVEIGMPPFIVNASLAGVIAQRLVRLLCPACKQAIPPPLEMLPRAARDAVAALGATAFCKPGEDRCDTCGGTRYRGRTAVHEILVMDDRVRHALAASADAGPLWEAATAGGTRSLLRAGLTRAADGQTTVEEVLRVVPADARY